MNNCELIEIIERLRNQRAFTYEDRMKLAMLDNAPFTIWANDKERKIVLWEGKCANVYGYNKEVVIGKDFADLIVSDYEKRKARIDCRDIIDEGTRFNNIANDVTFDKIPIILQTNCFRMQDVDSDKWLSVEFGVLTNSIQIETENTEKAVEIEKKVEALIKEISTIKDEINQYSQDIIPANRKKKLQKILNDLTALQTDHDTFENNCVKWKKYVEFINDFERQINTYKSDFQKIKDIKTTQSSSKSSKLTAKDIV
jgi:PAS domain-containing protein